MNTLQKIRKRKLLFEFFQDINEPENLLFLTNAQKIKKLQYNEIKTVFIITSEPVDPDVYIKLINEYARNNFEIKSIHIDSLDEDNLPVIRYQVENIYSSLSEGGCLVLSYGNSLALTVLGCFFVLSGKNHREAADNAEIISKGKNLEERERVFIEAFDKYLSKTGYNEYSNDIVFKVNDRDRIGEIKDTDINKTVVDREKIESLEPEKKPDEKPEEVIIPVAAEELGAVKKDIPGGYDVPADTGLIGTGDEIKEAAPHEKVGIVPLQVKTEEKEAVEDIHKEKIEGEKSGLPAAKEAEKSKLMPIDIDKGYQATTGRFYSSIRFKLVTIVSAIIILSLTSMIFLATYFFKKDNLVRVQENNLSISDVIALKVNTDINTIIDKSKFIINSVKKGEGQRRESMNPQDLLSDDSEIIFMGLMDMPGKMEIQNPSYIIYNRKLINKMQLLEKDIAEAYNANSDVFSKSFEGAKIVFNISKVIENQFVMALSFPYMLDQAKRINTIIVIFVNLDNTLKTFNPKGITKTFMVNDKGEVIIHPDKTLMQSGANMSNLPIISIMMQSPLDNGQTRFTDEKNTVFLGSFKKLGFGGSGVIAVSEEELALQEVYNIQRRNIYLMISVLSLAVLIVFFFGKSLTSPIKRLVIATNYIKEGHYLVDIKPTSNDEIGHLTASFVEMGKGLDEREKMKAAFGKFVNKEIAEMALHGEIRLGGERKEAAVFFSDIRAFTAISEKLEPEEVVEFLNEYMTRMVKCINETNGLVDKYIGDAIMAEWGVPISRGNDTENAVTAAIKMRYELIKFNDGRGGPRKPVIKIGCGINTGPVLAGQIGSEDKMEYTVIGDAVNLASRIEQLNKPFGTDILISEDSYKLVKEIFAVEKMAPITVKGKEDRQQIYAVLGRLDDPARPKDVAELRKMLGIPDVKLNLKSGDEVEEELKYEILDS